MPRVTIEVSEATWALFHGAAAREGSTVEELLAATIEDEAAATPAERRFAADMTAGLKSGVAYTLDAAGIESLRKELLASVRKAASPS